MSRGLNDIKVGDRLWIDYDRDRIICTVLKLTPKQVVVDWPWGKDGARFYRGKLSRYDKQPHWRKIGYSGWHGSEIQAIATKAECQQYDAKQEERKRNAANQAQIRADKEAFRENLRALFGDRMIGVGEAHHTPGVEWEVRIYLTTDGVRKLPELLTALTADELPSWPKD